MLLTNQLCCFVKKKKRLVLIFKKLQIISCIDVSLFYEKINKIQ